jgi:hypothetical protein
MNVVYLSLLGVLLLPPSHNIDSPIEVDATKLDTGVKHGGTLTELQSDIIVHVIPPMVLSLILTPDQEHLVIISKYDGCFRLYLLGCFD